MERQTWIFPAQVSLGYALFATLWIVFSDRLLLFFLDAPELLTSLQSIKGGLFVVTTALLLYLVLMHDERRRRQADAALRTREARFRLMTEQARDIVYRYRFAEPRGFEYVSAAATMITGYTPEEHYADPDLGFKMVYEEDKILLQQLAGEHTPNPMLLRWVRKDGAVIWTEQHNTPIYDEGGTLIAIEGIARDVTARKLAEDERDRFFNLSLDMLCIAGFDGYFKRLNPAWSETLGFVSEELLARPYIDFVHPDDRASTTAVATHINDGDHANGFENRYLCKDGSYRWIEWRSASVPDRQVIYAVARDITERKRAELRLRRAYQLLQSMFSGLKDAVVLVNPHTRRIEDCNPATEQIFGYSRAELVGRTTRRLHVNDDLFAQFGDASLASYPTNGFFETDYLMKRKNGETFPTEHFVRPLYDEQGNLLIVVSVVRDITARRQVEAALHESRTRLEILSQRLIEAQEAERRRIARELHDETGQALTALKINLYTLRSPSDPAVASQRLDESIAIVDTLLQQVRALSLDLRPSLLDDLGLVPALEWYVDRLAQRSGLIIEMIDRLDGHVLPAALATTCFRIAQEALTNIVRHAHAQHVSVSVGVTEGTLELLVNDDGVGFDVQAVWAQALSGTSLGLISMHERTEMAGGRMEILSAVGRGTTIRARFALVRDSAD